jgi:hypothetical protein
VQGMSIHACRLWAGRCSGNLVIRLLSRNEP